MAEPRRKISSAKMVNRIFLRSSGIFHALRMVSIIQITSTFPPAASIFSLAEAEKAEAWTVSFLVMGAVAQDLDAVLALGEDALLQQSLGVDHSAVLKLLQSGDVDGLQGLGENVVETALGDAAGQRHLAALKTHADAAAGAGPLALLAAAGGLAVAGTVAAALAVGLGVGAGGGESSCRFIVSRLL